MAMANTVTVMNDVPDATGIVDIHALISKAVEDAIAAKSVPQANPIVDPSLRSVPYVEPPKYLKHYRNDKSPDIVIVVRSVNDGVLGPVIKGKYIKFRRWHDFALTQEEVDFIEWLMSHPEMDPQNPESVVGGNPSIYEADGKDLVTCPHCDELFVAGSNALKAHMRASHGAS